MLIGRISDFTGKKNYLELDIDEGAYFLWMSGAGPLIQDAFPRLSAGEREFMMTGITPQEWINMFGEEATDDYDGLEPRDK